MIWMKATVVPFRIARLALAELLLAQAPAYIVRSSMSTVKTPPTLLTCSEGKEPFGPAAFGVIALAALPVRSTAQRCCWPM